MKYSIIIPVYNRPQEIKELLESLTTQTYQNFEVLVVEDGSQIKCDTVVQRFIHQFNIQYLDKHKSGPGLSRNYGAAHASGDYLIFLDSDCIIPPQYLEEVQKALTTDYADAFGGADCAASTFNKLQKAISYSMTSFFTTGGIRRGGRKKLDKFYPRSFNMGYSIEVYRRTQGFSAIRLGEDIDMSIRIFKSGFKVRYIEEAYVYHKRRTDFKKFYKQVFNFGIARINLYRKYPETLKVVHLLPATFTIGLAILLLLSLFHWLFLLPVLLLMLLLFVDSTIRNKSLSIGLLSVPASFIQLIGYGCGFLYAFWNNFVLKRKD